MDFSVMFMIMESPQFQTHGNDGQNIKCKLKRANNDKKLTKRPYNYLHVEVSGLLL